MKKTTRSIIAAALCASMMLAGCSNNNTEQTTTASQTAAVQNTDRPEAPTSFKLTESTDAGNSGDVKLEKGDTYAVISIRDFGDIKIKLYPDLVPYGVYNFIELAKNGTYNGRNIHRIEEDFMLQGGSASGDGSGGSSFEGGEFKQVMLETASGMYQNGLSYEIALEILNRMVDELEPEMSRNLGRWGESRAIMENSLAAQRRVFCEHRDESWLEIVQSVTGASDETMREYFPERG